MKKILSILLISCFLFTGCGNTETNSVQSNSAETNSFYNYNNPKNFEAFEVDGEELLQNGYYDFRAIAYLKIENIEESEKPIVYIVPCYNCPVQINYLMLKIEYRFDFDCDIFLTWNGQDYVMNDENDNLSSEEYINFMPADWREMLETIQSGDDEIRNMISLAWAEAIDRELSVYFDKYYE